MIDISIVYFFFFVVDCLYLFKEDWKHEIKKEKGRKKENISHILPLMKVMYYNFNIYIYMYIQVYYFFLVFIESKLFICYSVA